MRSSEELIKGWQRKGRGLLGPQREPESRGYGGLERNEGCSTGLSYPNFWKKGVLEGSLVLERSILGLRLAGR